MLAKENLQELLDYKAGHPVLSVYLNTDPSQGNADVYKLKLRSKLKTANAPLEDAYEVERYIEQDYDWGGRSAAIYSCVPEGFFRAYHLAVPMRSRVHVNNTRPYVKPLVDLMDAYGYFGVALIDKQGVRLFSFHLGKLQEQGHIIGEDIQRIKHGGGSQARGNRGAEAHSTPPEETTDRNMREAAEYSAHFFSEQNTRRVLIGGTDENITRFRNYLPKIWQTLIVGTFPISMTASHAEVLEKAMEIGQAEERERETRLVEALITNASKGQKGVVNLDDTLGAVNEGRVHILLILEDLQAPGYRCQGCNYLTAQALEVCPFCSSKVIEIPDAIEHAVRLVLQNGGEVEVLKDNQSLKKYGGIGAILRY